MLIDEISQWVDKHREEILNLNKELVSIPSENRYPYGDEKKVQDVVYAKLKDLGCVVDMFLPTDVPGLEEHPAYLGNRHYKNRPNVVGKKPGAGGGRSILFSGHVDTVPVGDDPWTVDPFSGIVKDGKQYGLGVFDMKGGLVAAMMALKALSDLGIQLKGDVTIESVVDEEYGGANGTLACRLRGYKADIAIIPEPSNLSICPVNQGGSMYRITYKGRPGRSFSGERLENPVFAGSRFLNIFRDYEKYHGKKRSTNKYFADGPNLPAYVQGVKAGPVHLPLCDRVPSSCVIDVWIQCYPETTEEDLYQDFTEFYKKRAEQDEILKHVKPTIEKLIRYLPGSGIPEDHEIISITKRISLSFYKDGLPVHGAPFACDSFMFNVYSDTPALIWGPKGANAHAPDEYIFVDDFLNLVKMYALTMIEWCGVSK
ncbi:acetylornithine deacetylase [Caldalkalibacillus uzonensis]|uniref:Acetylornithine deacetylase n=1 Tax=Caldalkalibacillus uzonensis TaxID=353224 RepID=A0ABU0CQZ0_9BACI|nr:M20/M25/M40 family metallo-hydrolase [Caldalkalibacillus uzonensis]MDQ0338311.1 acetylornithine deacetylase [Caldalkalibacillus uzonensis]